MTTTWPLKRQPAVVTGLSKRLVNEAIESWLAEAELDDTEHAAIEEARAEAAEQGGIEFEAFFDELLGGQD